MHICTKKGRKKIIKLNNGVEKDNRVTLTIILDYYQAIFVQINHMVSHYLSLKKYIQSNIQVIEFT